MNMMTRTTSAPALAADQGQRRRRHRRRRAFSIMEMLIAITISSLLMVSLLSALDTMYKLYTVGTDSASTHVVSRITMSRLLGMIRTGSDFGPFPNNVLDESINPLNADYFEFVSLKDENGDPLEITRVEYRPAGDDAQLRTWGNDEDEPTFGGADNPGELWLLVFDATAEEETLIREAVLISGIERAVFSLQYDVGPRLTRATIDFNVRPDDDIALTTQAPPETIRLVASAVSRQLIE